MTKPTSTDFLLPTWKRLGFDSKEQFDTATNFINTTYAQWYENDRIARSIEYLTGYSLDDLLRLFAAGWTLQPPSTTAINLADYTQEDDE